MLFFTGITVSTQFFLDSLADRWAEIVIKTITELDWMYGQLWGYVRSLQQIHHTQSTFACSKSTREIPEKCAKSAQSQQ